MFFQNANAAMAHGAI